MRTSYIFLPNEKGEDMLDQRDALELGMMLSKDRDRVSRLEEIFSGMLNSNARNLISPSEQREIRNILIYLKQDLNVAVRALPGEKPPTRSRW